MVRVPLNVSNNLLCPKLCILVFPEKISRSYQNFLLKFKMSPLKYTRWFKIYVPYNPWEGFCNGFQNIEYYEQPKLEFEIFHTKHIF